MPYIVTTYADEEQQAQGVWRTRLAVATLKEAHGCVLKPLKNAGPSAEAWRARIAAHALTESGGTVGPFSEGTLITVEAVEWKALVDGLDGYYGPWQENEQSVLAAFNERDKPPTRTGATP